MEVQTKIWRCLWFGRVLMSNKMLRWLRANRKFQNLAGKVRPPQRLPRYGLRLQVRPLGECSVAVTGLVLVPSSWTWWVCLFVSGCGLSAVAFGCQYFSCDPSYADECSFSLVVRRPVFFCLCSMSLWGRPLA